MAYFDPQIVISLQSSDPKERMNAVRALGRIPANDSLRYLATIYTYDPDELVRDLALQAGRNVKKLRVAGDWMADEE